MYIPWWGVIVIIVVLIIIWQVFKISIENLASRVDELEEKQEEDKRPIFDD